ncbi:MAG: hypothetical protein J6L81_05375 [Clostridia bacterium]|nr:hypothetical protein [Clostridia bacterium]
MKKVLLIVMMIGVLALAACGMSEEVPQTDMTSEVTATDQTIAEKQESNTEEGTAESDTAAPQLYVSYAGEYLDYEYNEPELKIYDNGNGTYRVNIGIIRLAVFEDDDAVATAAGLEFTATDDAGNPIKGVITLGGNDAVVTFTESTWSLIPSGTVYQYYKPES